MDSYIKTGNYEEAVKIYELFRQDHPLNSQLTPTTTNHNLTMYAYEQLGNYEEFIKIYKLYQDASRNPNLTLNTSIHYKTMKAHFLAGSSKEEISIIDDTKPNKGRLSPENLSILNNDNFEMIVRSNIKEGSRSFDVDKKAYDPYHELPESPKTTLGFIQKHDEDTPNTDPLNESSKSFKTEGWATQVSN